jgi:hypothetical protein
MHLLEMFVRLLCDMSQHYTQVNGRVMPTPTIHIRDVFANRENRPAGQSATWLWIRTYIMMVDDCVFVLQTGSRLYFHLSLLLTLRFASSPAGIGKPLDGIYCSTFVLCTLIITILT